MIISRLPHSLLATWLVLAALIPRQAAGQDVKATFEAAVKEMDAHAYATACPKLESVVASEPQKVGARLALALCYEEWGKLGTAWRHYGLAAELAAKAKDKREAEARGKGAALRARAPAIILVVPPEVRAMAGFKLLRDGQEVEAGEWDVPVPADAGEHAIAAAATGRKGWASQVQVAEGDAVRVEVPVLVEEAPAAPPPPPVVVPPPPSPPPPSAVIEEKLPPAVEPKTMVTASPRRTLGIAVIAVGGAGLALGAVMGGLVIAKHGEIIKTCEGSVCPRDQKATIDPKLATYHTYGAVSTAGFIVGGVLAGAGTVLIVTAPKAKPEIVRLDVRPTLGPGWVGVEGRF